MRRLTGFAIGALGFVLSAGVLSAQQQALGACTTPDTVIFRGNSRTSDAILRQDIGVTPGQTWNARVLTAAIKNLFAEGQYQDILPVQCQLLGGKTFLIFTLVERPVLVNVDVTGVEKLSASDVKDRIDLLNDRPVDPSQIARAITRIDSLYAAAGYYLARVKVDTVMKPGGAVLTFRIDEGPRLAISGITILDNHKLSDGDIVGAMTTKPEGFFWWRTGEFDDDAFATDLLERLPELYASRGFIDMQVVEDTLEIDRERGKALIQIRVNEGPQYHVGSFEVDGSHHFSDAEIAHFYPFQEHQKTLTQVVKGIVRPSHTPSDIFNKTAWDDATTSVETAYSNEGYIFAQVNPVIDRTRAGPDSVPTVNLRWEVTEGAPAIIGRVDISGNDVTSESCIRDQIFVVPGDVYSQDRLMRSWQNIGNLGFFETPLPEPQIDPTADHESVDLTLKVKEKRTGNLNFGASVGQGTGLGGFIGFDQPNLFGLCKKGSIQWQYGQFVNDLNLSYTDPHLEGTRVSGTLTAYHSESRFTIGDLGQSIETGGDVRLGFPLAHSRVTRLFIDYGLERVRYGNTGLVDSIQCNGCIRSTLGATIENDTQIGSPFPYQGSTQSITAQFNGGPLGGSAQFTRYLANMRTNLTLAKLGPSGMGSSPMLITFGLSMKAGAVFGNPGPFFVSQAFSLGGTQYGEPLRGYPEFSITPGGYVPNASEFQAQRSSFGNAFYTSTIETGLRVSDQLYTDIFYDAGNIWDRPQDFDPTRLFRGIGFGAAIVTPLGPLGVDVAYGLDRVDIHGNPAPAWQVHFKFGQLF